MPVDFSDPAYELEGGDFGTGNFVGKVSDAFFREGEYGLQLHMAFRRSEEGLLSFPGAKAEITWSWRCGPGWTTRDNGLTAYHESKTQYNANTAVGKMFKALKSVEGIGALLPTGWSQFSAQSWKDLAAAGDIEWEWTEEQPLMADPANPGKFIPNKDPNAKPRRNFVPVKLSSNGAAPVSSEVDLAALGAPSGSDLLTALMDAASKNPEDGKFLAAVVALPGMTPELRKELAGNAAGVRASLPF